MNKVLLSILVCVVSSVTNAMDPTSLYELRRTGQEQLHDFEFVFHNIPEQIASKLDSKSFMSLSLVSNEFQAVCNAIPMKNQVAYFFSDAIECGNKKMIDRFIAQPDKWMFVRGKEEEVVLENGTDDTIKIVKLPFGPELQNFVGDCSFYCVKHADAMVRFLWFWKSPEMFENKPYAAHCTVFNIGACDDVVNAATTDCLQYVCNSIRSLSLLNEVGLQYASNISMEEGASNGSGYLPLSDLLYPVDIFTKKFGMFMVLVLAAQKNNTIVVDSILGSSMVSLNWIEKIANSKFYCLPVYMNYRLTTVSAVLKSALLSRYHNKK